MKPVQKPKLKNAAAAGQPRLPSLAPSKSFVVKLLLGITLLGLTVYSNSINSSFHFDDRTNIVENESIRSLGNMGGIWKISKARFLTDLTFAVNYALGGLNVTGFHLGNILIHTACAFLVSLLAFQVLRSFKTGPEAPQDWRGASFLAAAAGLVFLCHPVQTQPVNYIVQRATLLACFFYLLTIVCYLEFRIKGSMLQWGIALASCAAAMFSKESAFTLPLMLLGLELFFIKEKQGRKRWLMLLPFLGMLLITPAIVNMHALTTGGPLTVLPKDETEITRSAYFYTQMNVLRTYWRILFVPTGLNLDYDYPVSQSFTDPAVSLSFLLHLGIFASAFLFLKRNVFVSLAIFWFYLTLSVESSLIPIHDVIFEHRLYLPLAGFAIFAAAAIWQFCKNVRSAAIVCAVLVLAYAGAAYQRNMVWRDEFTLWSDVIRKSPNKARGYFSLSEMFGQIGDRNREIEYLKKTIELAPAYGEFYYNLGLIYDELGRRDEAMNQYKMAVEKNPEIVEARDNLAVLTAQSGNVEGAIAMWQELIKAKPSYAPAYKNLAVAYKKKGDEAGAQKILEEARRAMPENAAAFQTAGTSNLQVLTKEDLKKMKAEARQKRLARGPGEGTAG